MSTVEEGKRLSTVERIKQTLGWLKYGHEHSLTTKELADHFGVKASAISTGMAMLKKRLGKLPTELQLERGTRGTSEETVEERNRLKGLIEDAAKRGVTVSQLADEQGVTGEKDTKAFAQKVSQTRAYFEKQGVKLPKMPRGARGAAISDTDFAALVAATIRGE